GVGGAGSGEWRGVKWGAGVVDQLGNCVRRGGGEAAREPPLEMRLERVVRRIADVVAVQGDGGELREAPQKLLAGDGGRAERGGGRDDAVIGVRHLLGELSAERELRGRKLIQIR